MISSRGVVVLRRASVVGVVVLTGLVPAAAHSDPPALRVSSPTVEATGPGGADATYNVKAFDPTSGNPLVATCDVPLGTSGIGGLNDTTAPVVTVPDDFSVDTESSGGRTVSFSASANDNVDGPLTPTCSPASGSTFPVGTTKVTCTATDSHGNTGSADFNVTVNLVDPTPPVVNVPGSFSVSTPDPSGTSVTFSASANDNVDGPVTPSCSPSSGSNFPVGTTKVTCTATDSHGNTGSASFNVTVNLVDTTPPVITVPASFSRNTPDPSGTTVTYSASARDNVDGALTPSCSPSSGSKFPVGQTTVPCSGTDSHGNTAQKSFTVTVVLVDTTAPVVTVPADISVTTPDPAGTAVSYTASANDNLDGPIAPSCTPASGAVFAVGTTTVTCTATDAHGNSSQATFKVTVVLVDVTPPVFSNGPGNMRREADGPKGSVVTYTAPTARDY